MKIKANQLNVHLLRDNLAPIYFLTGDEPLQHSECTDAIRNEARQQGYAERVVLHVEGRFDWSLLLAEANSLSLFASRRIIELRLGDKSPGQEGAKALQQYVARPPSDTILIISAGRQNAATQKTKWFLALENAGVLVQIFNIEPAQLPGWVAQRMRNQGLQADADVAALIAERAEGHLLAAAQEIEKLHLLYGEQNISLNKALEAVADSARFEVFGWVDTLLAADSVRIVRQLQRLRAEGIEAALIISLLNRDLRTFSQLAYAQQQGQLNDGTFTRHKIWGERKNHVRNALQRHDLKTWQGFLLASVEIEKMLKGEAQGNVWDALLALGLKVAGIDPLKPRA